MVAFLLCLAASRPASAQDSNAPKTGGDAPAAEAPPHAVSFAKKCGSCHTLGEGDRAGPDLLGATKRRDRKWLTSFIRSPGTLIDGGDAAANELVTKFKGARMPDQTLKDEELSAFIDYIDECTKKGGCKLVFGKVKAAKEATLAEVAEGRALFEGTKPLAAGGPPCISCHEARGVGLMGGGTLARDLTLVYARLGEQGLSSALETTPFPLMKNLYVDKPLRDHEAFKIKAFLYASAQPGAQGVKDQNFLYLGVLGSLLSFAAIGAVWSNRNQGVRRSLVLKRRMNAHGDKR